MMSETKAALAIGLVIIIGFGFVLAQVKGTAGDSALTPPEAVGGEFTLHALEPQSDEVKPLEYRPGAPRVNLRGRPIARKPAGPSGSWRPLVGADREEVQPPTPRPAPRPRPRTYTVQPKDSLSRIASKVYGSGAPKYYNVIYQANKDRMRNVATLREGQELVIPPHPDGKPLLSARYTGGGDGGSMAMRDGGTR